MKKKLLALLLAAVMVLSLAACGGKTDTPPADSGNPSTAQPDGGDSTAQPDGGQFGYNPTTGEEVYGPYWDEWSDMTDEELYEQALKEVEGGAKEINVYATSSKMLKIGRASCRERV